MTARYPSFIPATDSKSDAAPLSFSGSYTVSHAPIEEPARYLSSVVHQQAPFQLYNSINCNSTTHGNPVSWTNASANHGYMIHGHHHSALGFSTDGSTNPDPPTNSNDHFNSTWNDRSIIPPAGPLSISPPSLGSAYDQINESPSYDQHILGLSHSGPSNIQFQPNTPHTLDVPSNFGAPWLGFHGTTPVLQPDTYPISPRTDAHPPTLYGPHYSSLSTPDGSMGVPVLSSGPSPSFSQHHRTPSSVSSFILNTPDENPRHLDNCYQTSPNTVDHTSSHQRPAGALASRQVAQKALRQSAIETKQPKATPNNTLKVPGYRKIAPAPSGYVEPQKDSPSCRGTKQARRGRKETPRTPFDRSRKLATQPLPPDTVVFKESLTPTNIGKDSFNTSSRKDDETIIARFGVNAEAGYSIAPTVQAKLHSTRTPSDAAKRTPVTGPTHSWRRRNSKEAQGGGSTSTPRRTSGRSPPAKPQNSTSQNAGTLPTLGKRQKRHTTDSNSSSNSSKTPTGRSRTNSREDQKPTPSSSQQRSDSSNSRIRSLRKNPSRIDSQETSAAISVQRTEPTSSQRNLRQWPVPLGGRSKPVGQAVAKPRTGSTQGKSMSYRNGPTRGAGYQAGWGAVIACTQGLGVESDRTQQQLPATIIQDGSMDPEQTHYLHSPAVDRENLLWAQTLPGPGNFTAESEVDDSYNPYNVARSGYVA